MRSAALKASAAARGPGGGGHHLAQQPAHETAGCRPPQHRPARAQTSAGPGGGPIRSGPRASGGPEGPLVGGSADPPWGPTRTGRRRVRVGGAAPRYPGATSVARSSTDQSSSGAAGRARARARRTSRPRYVDQRGLRSSTASRRRDRRPVVGEAVVDRPSRACRSSRSCGRRGCAGRPPTMSRTGGSSRRIAWCSPVIQGAGAAGPRPATRRQAEHVGREQQFAGHLARGVPTAVGVLRRPRPPATGTVGDRVLAQAEELAGAATVALAVVQVAVVGVGAHAHAPPGLGRGGLRTPASTGAARGFAGVATPAATGGTRTVGRLGVRAVGRRRARWPVTTGRPWPPASGVAGPRRDRRSGGNRRTVDAAAPAVGWGATVALVALVLGASVAQSSSQRSCAAAGSAAPAGRRVRRRVGRRTATHRAPSGGRSEGGGVHWPRSGAGRGRRGGPALR